MTRRIAIAFLTKDQTELSSRTISPLLQAHADIFWIDGSTTEKGRTLPHKISLDQPQNHHIFVHANVLGGPDAAVAYALTQMLKGGDYTYIGLCESDVLLQEGWFEHTMDLFEVGECDGLQVGAVSARCYQDRILVQRDAYAVCHNLGFGQAILTREAAWLALANMRTGWSTDNRRLFAQLSGIDIGAYWAFRASENAVTADWNQDRVLASHGLASLALTPTACEMLGQTPPLDQQGLVLAKAPIEDRRNDVAFDRYVHQTAAIREGKLRPGTPGPIYVDDGGRRLYFPHQLGLLDARFGGDWNLKWFQGMGPFGWKAGATIARGVDTTGYKDGDPVPDVLIAQWPTLDITLSGSVEFLVSGGDKGGQIMVEDLHSGYTVKPTLPSGTAIMGLVAPCGVSHRQLRLTALAPGVCFHGIRTREPQPERTDWAFDYSALPGV